MKKLFVIFLALAVNANAEIVPVGADLQTAINNNTDGIIELQDGTYEGGFVIDNKVNLTIKGQGESTIIKGVGALDASHTMPTMSEKSLILVSTSYGIKIQDLSVNGDYKVGNDFHNGIGIYNSNIDIDGVTVDKIRENPKSGAQRGKGIYAKAEVAKYNLNITNCTVKDFQKNGIDVRGRWNVTLSGNTVEGFGETNVLAQNGILTYGLDGSATITNNNVSGINYHNPANPSDGWAVGLFVDASSTSSVLVQGNEVEDSNTGVYASGDIKDVSIIDNDISSDGVAGKRGISIETPGVYIQGNDIDGMEENGIEIYQDSAGKATVIENDIKNSHTGIYTEGDVEDITISDNSISTDNNVGQFGIHTASANALIQNNEVVGMQEAGIKVEQSGQIINNEVYECENPIATAYEVIVSGNKTERDTIAPELSGLKAKKVKGTKYRVAYTVVDNSNRASEDIAIKRAPAKGKNKNFRTFKRLTTELQRNGQRKVTFNFSRQSKYIYKACVVSTDESGNKSKEKCVSIK